MVSEDRQRVVEDSYVLFSLSRKERVYRTYISCSRRLSLRCLGVSYARAYGASTRTPGHVSALTIHVRSDDLNGLTNLTLPLQTVTHGAIIVRPPSSLCCICIQAPLQQILELNPFILTTLKFKSVLKFPSCLSAIRQTWMAYSFGPVEAAATHYGAWLRLVLSCFTGDGRMWLFMDKIPFVNALRYSECYSGSPGVFCWRISDVHSQWRCEVGVIA